MVKRSPPSLLEPGVWTGMAFANVWGPMRWKRAKIHRGSRQRTIEPHYEAGYTSAVVIQPACCNRAGSIYIHAWHILARTSVVAGMSLYAGVSPCSAPKPVFYWSKKRERRHKGRLSVMGHAIALIMTLPLAEEAAPPPAMIT